MLNNGSGIAGKKILPVFVIILFFLIQLPCNAKAEDTPAARIEIGATIGAISPVGDFRQNLKNWSLSDTGVIDFDLILPMHESGLIRLRLDYFFGQYYKDTVPDKAYWMRGFGVGPEIGLVHGPVQPYGFAQYGRFSFFAGGYLDGAVKKQIREQVDGTGAWVFGGGGRIHLGSSGRWAFDIGFRYHRGFTASYLATNAIRDNPDGSFSVLSTRSQTSFTMFTLGFQYRPEIRRRNH